MYQMQHASPARKVAGSTFAAAVTTLIIYILEAFVLVERLPDGIPGPIQGAAMTIVIFLVGYYLPPASRDQIVPKADAQPVGPVS